MLATFCSPLRYTQGPGATDHLGGEMAALGLQGPAIILASASARTLCADRWSAGLGVAGVRFTVEPFSGECSLGEIERVAAATRRQGARVIVGAGGGKVLDTARAVAAALGLPFVSCPTVASTDAPCSALSIIYGEQGAVVECRVFRRNPDLVLVDTEVIAQAPPRLLSAGMGDALATRFEARACIESGVRNMRGGASSRSALALAELCHRTLLEDGRRALEAVRARRVTAELERVVEANTLLSGLGFESSGLAAAHAVHNGLTVVPATRGSLHGERVAFGTIVQLVLEAQPREVLDEALDFCTAVDLPVTLAGLGLEDAGEALLARIAERATAPTETIHNQPFPVTAAMVVGAIRTADALGRARLVGAR